MDTPPNCLFPACRDVPIPAAEAAGRGCGGIPLHRPSTQSRWPERGSPRTGPAPFAAPRSRRPFWVCLGSFEKSPPEKQKRAPTVRPVSGQRISALFQYGILICGSPETKNAGLLEQLPLLQAGVKKSGKGN